MTQVLLILACMALFVRVPRDDPWRPWLDAGVEHPGVSALLMLGAVTLAAGVIVLTSLRAGRRMDRVGDRRAVRSAERWRSLATLAAGGAQIAGVLALGWLDAVRLAIGNLVLIDELVALLPLLIVLVLGWWAHYPIERRLREAIMQRVLDAGGVIRPIESRSENVLLHVRHEVLLVLVPLMLIMGWGEVVSLIEADPPAWMGTGVLAEYVLGAGFAVGVFVILSITPPLLRAVWDTQALAPGEVRERIERVCSRWRVRVRELLLWKTHYSMANAAVMGLLAPLRYILMTDLLLEGLESDEIEAVAAHEVAHVRMRHMPWLAGAILAPVTIIAGLSETLGARVESIDSDGPLFVLGVGSLTVVVLVWVLGSVSRRFEWQADAFAVRHLSEVAGSRTATIEAAESMSGALLRVAAMGGMSELRGSWRHGSIAERRTRLAEMIGQPLDDLPIDRQVQRVKRLIALGGIMALGVIVFL